MKNIIIIEDEKVIRNELKLFLERHDYFVKAPSQFNSIVSYILEEESDLILLDINLPIYDGFFICKEVRKKSDVPIIMVTSRDTDMDELMSMNLGADDFITKPFNTKILLARMESLLKRTSFNNAPIAVLNHGPIQLNLANATILYEEKEEELTKNEIKILSYLIRNKGVIVSRISLMEYLWTTEYFVDDSTLSVNMTRIRKKLKKIGIENLIETRRGLGYIIQ